MKFAAMYSLAEVLAPIAVFGYILILGANQNTKDRWLRTAAWCAIGASAYGWYRSHHSALGCVLGHSRRHGRLFGTSLSR